jgi:hypothetical protein
VSRLFSLLLLFLSISLAVPKHVKETLKELSPGIYGVFGVYERVNPKTEALYPTLTLSSQGMEL